MATVIAAALPSVGEAAADSLASPPVPNRRLLSLRHLVGRTS
jgi:hypothetical protein